MTRPQHRERTAEPAVRYAVDVTAPSTHGLVDGTRIVGFRARPGSGASFDMPILPRPSCGIILDCTSGSVESVGSATAANGLVGGMAPHAGRIRGSAIDCLELQISPVVAAAVLDVSPTELNRPFFALDEIWGSDGERLRSQLIEEADWDRRFALVHAVLTKRYRARWRTDPEIADAWRHLLHTGGNVGIAELAPHYGWSRTRFWNRFKTQIGVSPKRAARIVRFDRALRLVCAGVDLATVAASCGYADQSHLNRHFLEFGATTPGQLRDDPLWTAAVSGDLGRPSARPGVRDSSVPERKSNTPSASTSDAYLMRSKSVSPGSPVGIPRVGSIPHVVSSPRRRAGAPVPGIDSATTGVGW